jgi:hypothetical protein
MGGMIAQCMAARYPAAPAEPDVDHVVERQLARRLRQACRLRQLLRRPARPDDPAQPGRPPDAPLRRHRQSGLPLTTRRICAGSSSAAIRRAHYPGVDITSNCWRSSLPVTGVGNWRESACRRWSFTVPTIRCCRWRGGYETAKHIAGARLQIIRGNGARPAARGAGAAARCDRRTLPQCCRRLTEAAGDVLLGQL